MKLCSIVPLKNLNIVNNRPINMLLVHLCENEAYLKWAINLQGYKIMDNSIIELGEASSFENLVNYALVCGVDEIILPDVFKDGEKTYHLVKKCISQYKKLKKENPMLKYPKLMAVCHGNNKSEFKQCFDKLNKLKEVDVIGIPKVTSTWCGSRSNLFDIYSKTNKEIHLLGCWSSLKEITSFTKEMMNKIRSIDTCLPALLSIEKKSTFEERNLSKTIDLKNDEINETEYDKIISKIDAILE